MKPKLLTLSIILACASLQAHAIGNLADVTVVDRDSGATLALHFYRGDYWVAGRPGARYAVSVRNKLAERLLTVPSVDGVNVLSGETASWDQSGYVFSPHEKYQITGWRKSNSEVAAFEFSDARDSYAGRTGRPGNVGVIGVALFREKLPELVTQAPPYARRSDAAGLADRSAESSAPSAPSQRAPSASDNLAKAGSHAQCQSPASVCRRLPGERSPAPAALVQMRRCQRKGTRAWCITANTATNSSRGTKKMP